jgi:hypothetical protein
MANLLAIKTLFYEWRLLSQSLPTENAPKKVSAHLKNAFIQDYYHFQSDVAIALELKVVYIFDKITN